MSKILVVDDIKAITDILSNILTKEGHDVTTAPDGTEAIEALNAMPYDLVITDMLMPKQDGFDVISHVKNNVPETKVIVMTGGGVAITPADVIRSVGDDIEIFLTKPIGKSELLEAVSKALNS